MEEKILNKLNTFLNEYENIEDVIGVLACGSYVTGNPNTHSDLDVHLILKLDAGYRERGNRVVDGLLIEYFANSQNQVLSYFKEDYFNIRPMSQTQFATGEIVRDDFGVVENLKLEAQAQLNKKYIDIDTEPSKLTLYTVWDMLDDLQSIYEEDREDFDFIYYNKLDNLLGIIFKTRKIPYNTKTLLGHLTNSITRKKYLLDAFEDEKLAELIVKSVTESDKKARLDAFSKIANNLLNEYSFDISRFTFKSKEKID